AVKRDQGDAIFQRFWVFHHYVIGCLLVAIGNLIGVPLWRNARSNAEPITFSLKAQQVFQGYSVKPAGGACVPSPAATTNMRRLTIDIGGDYIRLNLVESGGLRS